MIKYENIIMVPPEHSAVRYALIKEGVNPVIVIGFNPSTADEKSPDRTMQSVLRISATNGYDGFVMLNVYPMRSTSPDLLPEIPGETLHQKNIEMLNLILEKYPSADVLVAWGNLVYKRKYMQEYATEIYDILKKNYRKILCIDVLKSGMPKHPLYASSKLKLKEFVLES